MMAPRVLIVCMSLLLAEVTGLRNIRRAGGHHDEYECSDQNQPINCVNNPRVRIVKSKHYYYINISQLLLNDIRWNCKHICQYCSKLLMGQGQYGT